MPTNLKPPNLSKLEVVCFHYEPEKNKDRIILQIPNDDFSDSSTYYLSLNSAADTAYLLHQKNGLKILDMLKLHGHVMYKNGEAYQLEIVNEAATTGHNPFASELARRSAEVAGRKSQSNWKVSALWGSQQKQ